MSFIDCLCFLSGKLCFFLRVYLQLHFCSCCVCFFYLFGCGSTCLFLRCLHPVLSGSGSVGLGMRLRASFALQTQRRSSCYHLLDRLKHQKPSQPGLTLCSNSKRLHVPRH